MSEANAGRPANRKTRRAHSGAKSASRSLYLKPGLAEDDLLIAVWDAALTVDRPQNVYRRLLLEGMRRLIERGDFPDALARNPQVKRHLSALGEVAPLRAFPVVTHIGPPPAMHAQPPGLPAMTPAAPAAAPVAVQPQPAQAIEPRPEPAPIELNSQKDSPKKRKGLSADLM